MMKKIEAIVRPERVSLVQKALEEIGHNGITLTEVKGHGVQRGITQKWRGNTVTVDLLQKVKIEVVVRDEVARVVMKAIADNARTGEVGDGKIFVTTVDAAMRVRTGETGPGVL